MSFFFLFFVSAAAKDLSDAINLSRRRPPEGREEPSRAADEELRLASSFVDQIDDADRRLHRLLRLVERLLRDKDLTVQLLADDKYAELSLSLSLF